MKSIGACSLGILIVLAACGPSTVGEAVQPKGPASVANQTVSNSTASWRSEVPLPVAMAEVGVAALDGIIYVAGGTEEHQGQEPKWDSSLFMAFDPQTKTWRKLASMPKGLSHVGLAALDGKVYAAGGFTGIVHMGPQAGVYAYDPKTNEWAVLPDLSSPRGSVALVALNGKLHAIGGRQADKIIPLPMPPGAPKLFETRGTVTLHQIFDPVAKQWSTGAPLPGPGRDHMGIAVIGNRIHVFGGRVADTDDNLARHDVYDAAKDVWTSAAPLPVARSAGAAAVSNGKILYAGGECKPGGQAFTPNAYDDVTAYDPANDSWSVLPSLPSARHGFGGANIGDRAYVVAGAPVCGGGASPEMLSYGPTDR
jgi:N-acetylneuraminic acid mutarotase